MSLFPPSKPTHPAGDLFASRDTARPIPLQVLAARSPLRFLRFDAPSVPGQTIWVTSYGRSLRCGDYVCQPWGVLSHVRSKLCNVYAVLPVGYRHVQATSKAQVEADQPTAFAFAPVRNLQVIEFGAGLIFNARLPIDLSLHVETPALTSLLGDADRPPGVQLQFANDAFAMYTVGGLATLVTVTQLPSRTLTALTAL